MTGIDNSKSYLAEIFPKMFSKRMIVTDPHYDTDQNIHILGAFKELVAARLLGGSIIRQWADVYQKSCTTMLKNTGSTSLNNSLGKSKHAFIVADTYKGLNSKQGKILAENHDINPIWSVDVKKANILNFIKRELSRRSMILALCFFNSDLFKTTVELDGSALGKKKRELFADLKYLVDPRGINPNDINILRLYKYQTIVLTKLEYKANIKDHIVTYYNSALPTELHRIDFATLFLCLDENYTLLGVRNPSV